MLISLCIYLGIRMILIYDREWYSASGLFTYNVRGEARRHNYISKMDVSGAEDYPPAAVLQNASTVKSSMALPEYISSPRLHHHLLLRSGSVGYLTQRTYKRSFQIYVDDQPYSKVIVPPFGGVVEVAITNITASSKTSITLMPGHLYLMPT